MSALPQLRIIVPMAIATLVAVGLLSRAVRRARREIGGEIEAATVVIMSGAEPPSPAKLRLVEQRRDEASAS